MNNNVVFGVLTFLLWSAFSTWYYVNYIKVFDPVEISSAAMDTVMKVPAEPMAAETTAKDSTMIVEEVLVPIEIARSFVFHKNTVDLINPANVQQFVDSLSKVINDRKVEATVIGYTCDLGTEQYNLTLGENRAELVAKILEASNIPIPTIETASKGEADPIVPNTSEENRVKNRRVTIVIKSQP
jgi:outer membrane protein OmpA-like peptidoglycan-associated protein